jgi:hypothetical protein
MKKISSRSIETAEAIGRHETFETYGALRGERRDPSVNRFSVWDSGRLSGNDLDRFREDLPGIVYIVFSYATPIAWVNEDGTVHRVGQKFSMTTSHHQGRLYLL